jgi:hypothetical protein
MQRRCPPKLGTPIAAALVAAGLAAPAGAQEPPIQSPQDAACRIVARDRVFTAPNPGNLSLWDLGSQIYHACMSEAHAAGPNPGRHERRF